MRQVSFKSLLAASFLATGMLASAQMQMQIYRSGYSTVNYNVSEIDSVRFTDYVAGQCSTYVNQGTLTPNEETWTTVSGSVSYGGSSSYYKFYRISVVSGYTYQFSTSSTYGGSSSYYSSLIALYNSSCTQQTSQAAGSSTVGTTLSWTATYSGYAYVAVGSNSSSYYGSYTLAYKGRPGIGSVLPQTLTAPTNVAAAQEGVVEDIRYDYGEYYSTLDEQTGEYVMVRDSTVASQQYYSVKVDWDATAGAVGYDIYYGTDAVAYSRIATGVTSPYTYRALLTTGSTYYFKVKAIGVTAESPMSTMVSCTVKRVGAELPAPAGLTAAASGGTVSITWTQTEGEAYTVTNGGRTVCTQVSNSCTDNAPNEGTNTYCVRINRADVIGADACTSVSVDKISDKVYLGVLGFNSDTMGFPITNNLSSAKNFINNLTNTQDFTALTYAVEKAVPFFSASGLPSFDKVFVITFTDGRDNQSNNLWEFRESLNVTDVFGRARSALLTKSGMQSYSIGLGEQLSVSEMDSLAVNGGRYVPSTSATQLIEIFRSVAQSVVAASRNMVLNTRYFSSGTKQFRLTVNATPPTGGPSVTDQIVCQITKVGDLFQMSIVESGTYATFTPASVTIMNPTEITRTLEGSLNNLRYIRNGTDYVLGNIGVETKTTGDWYVDVEDQVRESAVQRQIAVMLVLDCSQSLSLDANRQPLVPDAFPLLKDAAKLFIDEVARR